MLVSFTFNLSYQDYNMSHQGYNPRYDGGYKYVTQKIHKEGPGVLAVECLGLHGGIIQPRLRINATSSAVQTHCHSLV